MLTRTTRCFGQLALASVLAAAALPAMSANINFYDLLDSVTVDATQFDITPATITHTDIFGGEDDVRVSGQFISNTIEGTGDSWVGLVEPGLGCVLGQDGCYSDILHVYWSVTDTIATLTADFGSDPERLGTCGQCSALFEDGTLQNVNAYLDLPQNITIQIQSDVSDVPEPATLALLGIGLAGLGFSRQRKRH